MQILSPEDISAQVQILKLEPSSNPGSQTKAIGDILLFGQMTVRRASLIARKRGNGYFLGAPSHRGRDGNYYEDVEFGEPLRTEIERKLEMAAKEAKLI